MSCFRHTCFTVAALICGYLHKSQKGDPWIEQYSSYLDFKKGSTKGNAAKIADICGYLWPKNVFKVKATHGHCLNAENWTKTCHSHHSDDDNLDVLPDSQLQDMLIRNTGIAANKESFSRDGYEYQLDQFPGTDMLVYEDFTIYLRDVPRRTSSWVIERITRENVDHYEHRHFEVLKPYYKSRRTVDCRPFDISNLGGMVHAVLFPGPVSASDNSRCLPKYICRRCEVLSFRNVFHQYVKFLTALYNAVYICSGNLVVPKLNSDGSIPEDVVGENKVVTHYFKIIACKNKDNTYRFECYKIKSDPDCKRDIDLKSYLVSREQLNRDAGVDLIPLVKTQNIKETETHPEFQSTGSSPSAHQVYHSCKDCSPFQDAPLPTL